MTGDYANIVGVLYDVCKYLLIISPHYIIVDVYQKAMQSV